MKTVPLGSTSIDVPALALGAMRLADRSRAEASTIVGTALDLGMTFIDTADCYSAGESSRKVGEALSDLSVDRGSVMIQTKVGIFRDPSSNKITRYDFSREHIVSALDAELTNLRTDYVDSLLLHRPDTLVDLDDLAAAFDDIATQGKARWFGVSNVNPQQIDLLRSALNQRLQVNQLQFGLGHSGMVRQEFHVNMDDAASVDHDGGLLAYCRLHQLTIQAWSPLQYGFFSGVFLDDPQFPELNRMLRIIGERHGVDASAVAIAWILRHPAHMQVLLGSMTPERLIAMSRATDIMLDSQEWYDLYLAAGNDLP
ncbi:aldo/keto reductase [uncultured Bifidobacterium sp.]|uniref:aldo/keto reductase n=1 Tax=uncultured Bifidobacterium sp. TaxID=165187 RepID=UPI00260A1FCD|nr:aldo/keto reductase [uncultured Bifidobacterium sp.]